MNLQLTHKIIYLFLILNLGYPNVLFTDISSSSGINFSGSSEGVCVFDYNNDGWDDIFFTTRAGNRFYLYKNEGNMTFSDMTLDANLGVINDSRTVVAGDYDNDGDLDLFLGSSVGQSLMFNNDGEGHFQDVSTISGILVFDQVRGSSWIDFNSDGWLDLYIGLLYEPNKMYMNNGDGTFIDVAQNINVAGPLSAGIVMGLGFVDYDRDGDQDLFMTQDNNLGNHLFRYEDNGTFSDVSFLTNTNVQVMGMGVAFGDINRDGLFEIYTTNLYENSLLLNSSDGNFVNISESSGTEDIPGSMGWGTFFFDANNDGWVDIYNNNETAFGNVSNSLFINNGDLTFSMAGDESGAVLNNNGYGSGFSDLDHDGDLDMVLVGHSSSIGSINILRNDSESQNWILLKLSQPSENLFAVGATIELYHNGIEQLNYISAGNGYCSQNTFDIHFGLGLNTSVDSVIVIWPDGINETFLGLVVNEINYLNRGNGISILSSSLEKYVPNNIQLNDLYPNPFNSSITLEIKVEEAIQSHINIYNLNGQLVESISVLLNESNMNQIKINLSDNSAGIYFVNINVGVYTFLRKITYLK
ncbi:MAG: T9SS type A sorting domain-containing protein [Candidatus Marinimicrobia bacterium]|jgi:hypothetical protein|nr:T9SS type A sorting domain-containing protein [Candidatus Neomarinimicrobiota bacterium]MBT3838465.1 T9SS type A sorting domain-containing protein [Candidatus Neomarinimicrobiota bacterium]MBT4579594.1 T9SS type A sorting domain-containing protein [Candidatus Neomarinimicrobiota bacterium]MBT4956406.1 T9SS type A sorting domain-containing protein [Candidatus Neomarinimicrobiota bacterium]MBT5364047.1 T9SS type A sorting domain-containing protein [Candidatus Neomarinimicrobiota bacterium]